LAPLCGGRSLEIKGVNLELLALLTLEQNRNIVVSSLMEVVMFPVAMKNIAEDIFEAAAVGAFLVAVILFANAIGGGAPV